MTNRSNTASRYRVAVATIATLVAVATLLVVPARSVAMVERLTISQRAALASSVFVGRVGTHASGSRGRGIITAHDVTVRTVLKGSAADTVNLLGGTVGSQEEIVSDQPVLDRGATYLFFLDELGRPIGGPQGATEVRGGMLVGTDVSIGDVVSAVRVSALTPQQTRAFPELRTAAGRTAVFGAVDAAGSASTTAAPAVAGSTAAATAVPSIAAISPGEVAAGTGTIVEIDGRGFGTTPGKVEVAYDPTAGASFARWRVTPASWTDTRITFKVPVFTDSTNYPGSAGTGDVTITTSAGKAVGAPLRVTYAFDGSSWQSTPVTVCVNPSGSGSASALSMMQQAIGTWAGSGFPISYSAQTGMPVGMVDGNGLNEVGWARLTAGILAQTSWMPDDQGQIREEHIVFNTYYGWGDGSSGTFDIQTIALHELGHWVVLRDQYGPGDTAEVMYGYCGSGVRKRGLTGAELDGIRYVYGADRVPPTTPFSLTSSASFNGVWTSGDVTVTIVPPSDGNRRGTWYRLDYGPAHAISASTELPFVSEEYHDVMVWSSDGAGNNETPAHRTVAIDRTPPTSSSDATATYGGKAVITFSGSDNLSGISEFQWRHVGDVAWTTVTPAAASATIPDPGTYTLEYRALDLAGNVGETHLATFEILPLEPTELQLSTTSRNVTYGTYVSVAGTLTTGGAELVGQTVKLQASSDGKIWIDRVVQSTAAGGAFSFPVRGTSTTYFRVAYDGGIAGRLAFGPIADPPSIKIGSTASISTVATTRISTRTYDLSVVMMPRHKATTDVVRFYLWHREGTAWVPHQYVWGRASDVGTSSTKALRRFKFPHTGSWRVQARHADANHLVTWSSVRTISVR